MTRERDSVVRKEGRKEEKAGKSECTVGAGNGCVASLPPFTIFDLLGGSEEEVVLRYTCGWREEGAS